MSGTKRKSAASSSGAGPSEAKKLAVHSFFTGGAKTLGNFQQSPPTLVHFLHNDPFNYPSSTASTSSSAPNPAQGIPVEAESSSSTSTSKKISVIFYDLDGTLIKTKGTNTYPNGRDDWAWWHPSVPKRLKQEVDEGKHLIVISNQGDSREKIRSEWKAKVPLIAAKIPDVPLRILAGLSKTDVYRKPNIGMYQVVEQLYREKGYEIDLASSVFVGDAAGRVAGKGRRADHSNTDLRFAVNVGVRFVTPEEHFLGDARPPFPEPPVGFRPSLLGGLANLPAIVPSHTPITRTETEIAVFVGSPASGKTSFFRRNFLPKGYEHVNQDILKTRDRCIARAELLVKSGKSVVVDNTNRNAATRAYWVTLAETLKVPIRLFHFLCPIELARHNNMYRAVYAPKDEPERTLLPASAFWGYKNDYQAPHVDEGFDEVRGVNFVWEGTEEQRRLWDMYMLQTK